MKVKEGYLLRSFGDDYIVVATGEDSEDFNRLITLNSVGAFIFKKIKDDISREELIDSMIDQYEVDRATVEKDVDIYIDKLKEAGLLNA